MSISNYTEKSIGKPISRYEGHDKVTGKGKYAAEYNMPDIAYGVLVTSTIARGKIVELDSKEAKKVPGVLTVISHLNCPDIPGYDKNPASAIPIFAGREFKLFQDDHVYFNLQPIAMVVANSFEQARYAALLVKVKCEKEEHHTDIHTQLDAAIEPEKANDYLRGQADAWQTAPVKFEAVYETPIQNHNAMEPHAATAYWEAEDKLLIYNKTQAVKTTQQQFSQYFKLKPENVHVHAPFVGGAFGSASRMWPHEMAAVLGAKKTGRPVKVVLAREQMFNMVGYRPYSVQKFCIGADQQGNIIGINHHAYGTVSQYEQFTERLLEPTKSMYKCANLQTTYRLVKLDMSTPCPARGPGETSGSFAMESAVDELAYALKMDPLELRLKNLPEIDPNNNKPWSSNHLRECLELGAERFGWSKRNPVPGSNQEGHYLIGWGMSGGIYKSERTNSSANIKMTSDGRVLIRCSVADTGPGSATVMTQIAADALNIPVELVDIEWADSEFPFAPPQYGSHTTASTGSGVHDAAMTLKRKFIDLTEAKDITLPPNYTALFKQHNLTELEATTESKPGPEAEQFSGKSFCANYVEVKVHSLTGEVRVSRVVSVIDSGRIINHKTGRSQVLGSIVWGIGLALMEEGVVDHRFGRHVNNNLADYHVPVNADIPELDIHFIDKGDPIIDPMGAKGLGEIGLIGFTAAVANAVYHATGKRIRKLPITGDKLI